MSKTNHPSAHVLIKHRILPLNGGSYPGIIRQGRRIDRDGHPHTFIKNDLGAMRETPLEPFNPHQSSRKLADSIPESQSSIIWGYIDEVVRSVQKEVK